jgi:hypothetical protein
MCGHTSSFTGRYDSGVHVAFLHRSRCLRVSFLFLLPALIIAASAAAQETQRNRRLDPVAPMSRPVLGFAFDGAAAGLRPIFGVPGAARLGEPLQLGFAISYAVISPQLDSALTVNADGGQIVAVEFVRSEGRPYAVDGVRSGADKIVFSPDGRSAALYNAAARWITVLTGLPASPTVAAEFDVASIPGALTALALHDDHTTLLGGFSEDETGSLFLLRPAEDPALLSVLRHPSAARFFNHSRDAVITDSISSSIYHVRDVSATSQVVFLASSADGIDTPMDVEVSADDSEIVIADKNAVTTISLSDRRVNSYIHARPSHRLHRFSGKASFLLADAAGDSLLIFDGDSVERRIVIVPPFVETTP